MIQSVYLETSSRCNLSCTYCYRTSREYASKNRDMPLALAELFVDGLARHREELCGEGRPDLFLHSYGEPTLNPDLARMVALATGSGLFGAVRFVSNFQARPASDYDAYFQSGLTGLYVSLDSLDPAHVAATRRGTNLPLLLEAIRAVARSHAERLCVITVLTPVNQAELGRLGAFLSECGIPTWNIQLLNTRQGRFGLEAGSVARLKQELLASHPGMTINFEEESLMRCAQPFTTLAVNALGYLTPCCSLTNNEVVHFGNIAEADLAELYAAEPYRSFREGFRLRRPAACEGCPYY